MSSAKYWIVLRTSKFFVVEVWEKSHSQHCTLKIAFLIDEELRPSFMRDKIIFLLLDDGRGANLNFNLFSPTTDKTAERLTRILRNSNYPMGFVRKMIWKVRHDIGTTCVSSEVGITDENAMDVYQNIYCNGAMVNYQMLNRELKTYMLRFLTYLPFITNWNLF